MEGRDQLSSDLASLRIQRDRDPERAGPWRWVVIGVIVVGLLGAGYFVGLPYANAKLFKTQVQFTEVALVSPAQAQTELTATGYVTPQTISRVGAKVPGRVVKVGVKEGDVVEEGQLIVQIDDVDQRAAIAAARSRVLAARARAQAARANAAEVQMQLEREKRLADTGAVAKAGAENLAARAKALDEATKAAEAEAKVASAEVETLEVGLKNLAIRAPLSGTVLTKPPQLGDLVQPGAPVVDIADFKTLLVEADVPEGRLHLIKIGGPSEISLDAFPGKRYRGAVAELGRRINRAKATVTVKVRFTDPPDGVLPDMAARVGFLSKAIDDESVKTPSKLVVPAAAVTDRDGSKVVFAVGDANRVRMMPVELGPAFGSGFELKRGPTAGTRLVKDPPATLVDGQDIKEKDKGD